MIIRKAEYKIADKKCVYKVKYNTNGSVEKYKARLIAKGFQQIVGLNYFEPSVQWWN